MSNDSSSRSCLSTNDDCISQPTTEEDRRWWSLNCPFGFLAFFRQFDSLDQFCLESCFLTWHLCFSFENFLLPKTYFLSGNIVFDFFVTRLKWIVTMRTASPIQSWLLQFWHQWMPIPQLQHYSSKLWWNRKAVMRNQLLAKKKLIKLWNAISWSMIAAPTS